MHWRCTQKYQIGWQRHSLATNACIKALTANVVNSGVAANDSFFITPECGPKQAADSINSINISGPNYSASVEMSAEDSDQALSSFPVALGATGEGNEFRTQNASPKDWERRNVIERTRDAVHIYCDLMDVKHGTLGPAEGGELATLMVFRFRFDPQKTSRRILEATVKVDFIAANPYENPLEVSAIAPEERWSLATTTDHEQIVKGGDLSLGSGVSVVTAEGSIKREKTTTRDVSHATTVAGSINLGRGRNSGRRTVARWRLLENEKRRTGVPDSVRVAVMLSRATDQPFNAVVTIEAKADLVTAFSSSVSSLFRQLPLDDPILFNPKAESVRLASKGRSIDAENLGEVDLYGLCDARITGRRYLYSDKAQPEST